MKTTGRNGRKEVITRATRTTAPDQATTTGRSNDMTRCNCDLNIGGMHRAWCATERDTTFQGDRDDALAVASFLEQQPNAESYLDSINRGAPPAEVLGEWEFDTKERGRDNR